MDKLNDLILDNEEFKQILFQSFLYAAVSVLAAAFILCWWCMRRKRKRAQTQTPSLPTTVVLPGDSTPCSQQLAELLTVTTTSTVDEQKPPSYSEVMAQEAYSKQAPFNPSFIQL